MWLVFFYLIVSTIAFPTNPPSSATTSIVFYDSALGYPCYSDTNCQGLVGNAMCLNGICTCQPGYVPQGVMYCEEVQGRSHFFNDDY